jgi:hypothetical protein
MIYEELFIQARAWLGLPAAVIVTILLTLDFGFTPIDTVAMKTEKYAETVAQVLKGDHIEQANKLILQTQELKITADRTLGALKEICFNTARNNDARRRCGAL